MLKAHVIWFGQPMGFKIDINHNNITSTNILILFDNPMENWTDFSVHTKSIFNGYEIDALVSLKVNDLILLTYYNNLNQKICAGASLNKELIVFYLKPMKYGSLRVKLRWWNSNIQFKNMMNERESLLKSVLISFNGEKIMWFHQNHVTDEIDFLLQNVFFPFHISSVLQLHQFNNIENLEKSMKFLINTCWNTTNVKNDSFSFGISYRTTGDYLLTWLSER